MHVNAVRNRVEKFLRARLALKTEFRAVMGMYMRLPSQGLAQQEALRTFVLYKWKSLPEGSKPFKAGRVEGASGKLQGECLQASGKAGIYRFFWRGHTGLLLLNSTLLSIR
jgi:hypothetical protein